MNLFTSNNSWTGTQIFKKVRESIVTATTGAAYAIDTTLGTIFNLLLNSSCVYTFPPIEAGGQFTLHQKQDATGGRLITWPSSVRWAGDITPTITVTANKTDSITFICDGTYWIGYVGGLNYTRN